MRRETLNFIKKKYTDVKKREFKVTLSFNFEGDINIVLKNLFIGLLNKIVKNAY